MFPCTVMTPALSADDDRVVRLILHAALHDGWPVTDEAIMHATGLNRWRVQWSINRLLCTEFE